MNNTYFISRNYKSLYNAAGKAKTDCEVVLKKMGVKNLGFKQTSIASSAIGTVINFFGITWALLRLPYKSTLCTQYPLNKFYIYITFIANIKKCKIIAIIHDVKSLKGRTNNLKRELSKIKDSDAIIVHNPTMKKWFEDQNFTMPIIVLEIFDYLNSGNAPSQNHNNGEFSKHEIAYAGSLGAGKNAYLYNLDSLTSKSFKFKLYGLGFDESMISKDDSIISYEGAFPSNEIAYKINGSFGLVWDGNSLTECSGQYGQYLRFNNPHKTSLYILCGLPIIIWDKAALAGFVERNKIGVCVSSLKNLDSALKNIDKGSYKEMVANVHNVRNKIMTGGYLESAMLKAKKAI